MTDVVVCADTTICPHCRTEVTYFYVHMGGILSRPEYTLIADWIFHRECWDKQVEEHPTAGR